MPGEQSGATGRRGAGIRWEGVSHVYETYDDESLRALDDVSGEVEEQHFACLIGPSGCGKSTLLKVVGGLISPTSGTAYVDETPVVEPRPEIGYMFQEPTLLPWRSVIDNILLPLQIRGGPQAVESGRQDALQLLDMTGLQGFAESYPHQLSGGMAQRVAICRMLVTNPQVLLLDEPFGALDELTRERLNLELQALCHEQGVTVLMVTHSIQEAVFLSDSVLVMSPRPGSIADRFDIRLPRPRTVEMLASVDFGQATVDIRKALQSGTESAEGDDARAGAAL